MYSEAYDPCGGVQKTWTDSFDPLPKFSGKERDQESGLDYFGARYYDRAQYRFVSVDPILIPRVAVFEPDRLNLYSYCLNNPLSIVDYSGRWGVDVHGWATLGAGIVVGMPFWLAKKIAFTNAMVDFEIATTSGDINTHFTALASLRNAFTGPLEKWHFPKSKRLGEAYRICQATLDPVEFAQNLHTVQEAYIHAGFDAPWGHAFYRDFNEEIDSNQILAECTIGLTLELMSNFWDRYQAFIQAAAQAVRILCISIGSI